MTAYYSTKSFKIKDFSIRKLRDGLNHRAWLITVLYDNRRQMADLGDSDYYCVETGRIKLITEQDITGLTFEIVPRQDNDDVEDDDDAWDEEEFDDKDFDDDDDWDEDEPDDGEEDHDWGERGDV